MTSDAQRNNGYLIPEQITGYPLVCVTLKIPDNEQYIANFIGHLYELTKWWNWEKSYQENDTRASEAATYWRKLLWEHLCMKSCEEQALVQNSNFELNYFNYINDLLQLYDDTPQSIWSEAVYAGDGFNGDRDAALCWAISGFVDEICTSAIKYIDAPAGFLSITGIALLLVAGILSVPTFGASVWMLMGMAVGGASLATLGLLSLAPRDHYLDAGARAAVVCGMYDKLKGATLTNTLWLTALDDFTPVSDEETAIAEAVTGFLSDIPTYINSLKTIEQGFALSKIGAIEPCECGVWTVERLGGDGNANMVSLTIDGGLATYDSINDRYEGDASAGKIHLLVVMESPGVPFFVESINCEFTLDNTGAPDTTNYIAETNGEGALGDVLESGLDFVDGPHTLGVNDLDRDFLGIAFRLEAQGTGGFVRLNKITINGRGFNPFE